MKKPIKDLLLGIIALLWLMFIFSGYAVTNKPFNPNQLITLANNLWQTALAILLLFLCGGLGLAVLQIKQHSNIPAWSLAGIAASIGVGILAVYTLIWGSLIAVNVSIFLIPLLLLLFTRRFIKQWINLWLEQAHLFVDNSIFSKLIIGSLGLLILFQWVTAYAPPLAFDSLTYHFYIPQMFIQNGKITYLPDIMFWGMPKLNEMLYLLLMIAGGVNAAAIFNWLIGLLAISSLLGFVENRLSRESAWVAAASLVVGQSQVNLLGSGYAEWPIMLFGLGLLIYLSEWQKEPTLINILLAGVFAGLAISSKFTAGVALLCGLAVVGVYSKGLLSFLKNSIIFGGTAALILSPWLIKNYFPTGNFFYPLIFATNDFDALRMGFYNFAPQTQDWSRLIFLPIQATILGVENGDGFSASIGPLLLILSPLALLNFSAQDKENNRLIKLSILFLVTGFLIWAIASQFRGLLIQTRLYMVLFPAWAMLAGFGFERVKEITLGQIRLSFVAAVFIVLALGFRLLGSAGVFSQTNPLGVMLGKTSETTYLLNNTGNYKPAMDSLFALPKGSKVLMLWETRGYYCAGICDSDEIIDRWYHDWHKYQTQEALLKAWQEAGYSHLLIYTRGERFVRQYDKNAPFLESDWEALDQLKMSLPVLITFEDDYILYTLIK